MGCPLLNHRYLVLTYIRQGTGTIHDCPIAIDVIQEDLKKEKIWINYLGSTHFVWVGGVIIYHPYVLFIAEHGLM